jgi:hypothetical protein
MANRLEEEFPAMDLRWTPPLIGPDGLQHEIGRETAWREAFRTRAAAPEAVAGLWPRLYHAIRDAGRTSGRDPALTAGCS